MSSRTNLEDVLLDENVLKSFLCGLFNVDEDNVSVKTSFDGDKAIVDCSVNTSDGTDTINVETTVNKEPFVGRFVHDMFDTPELRPLNNVLSAFGGNFFENVLKGFDNFDKKNLKDGVQKLADKFDKIEIQNRLKNLGETIEKKVENVCDKCAEKVTDECKCHEDSCDCNDCKCETISRASAIKESIRKKFIETQEKMHLENAKNTFFKLLASKIYDAVIAKLDAGLYQSMTTDVDDEGAGIYIILESDETTEIEKVVRTESNFHYPVTTTEVNKNSLEDVSVKILEEFGFSESLAYITDDDVTIFKFWF